MRALASRNFDRLYNQFNPHLQNDTLISVNPLITIQSKNEQSKQSKYAYHCLISLRKESKEGRSSALSAMQLITNWISLTEYEVSLNSTNFRLWQSALITRLFRSQHSIAGSKVIASSMVSPTANISLRWIVPMSSNCRSLMRCICWGERRLMEEGFSMTIWQAVLPPLTKQESISLITPMWSYSILLGFISPWQVPSPLRQRSTSTTVPKMRQISISEISAPRLLWSSMTSSRVRLMQLYSTNISVLLSWVQLKAGADCVLEKKPRAESRCGWFSFLRYYNNRKKRATLFYQRMMCWQTVPMSSLRSTWPPYCGLVMYFPGGEEVLGASLPIYNQFSLYFKHHKLIQKGSKISLQLKSTIGSLMINR